MNSDIGRYTFAIEARTSEVNAPEIYFYLEIVVEITACITTDVSAP